MSDYAGPERRTSDRNLNEHAAKVAEVQIEVRTISADVAEIKADIRLLTQSLQKLVIIDERQSVMLAAQERIFSTLGKIEDRVRVLETAAPAAGKASAWMDKAGWGAIVLIAMVIFKKVGLA